ncbi:MAG: hypothetical protein NC084_12340 [Bacteroides sp.]|nr:hypothetical protein [Eubacterium sp.]MCM1419127.1 hypothetical protein [Roseburia sp.]MCM1463481.1 hypothetical protein [Bacteroides sp.]
MIKVGDRRAVRSEALGRVTGEVIYVHPARRFCVIEFEVNGGKIREGYQLIEGEIAE